MEIFQLKFCCCCCCDSGWSRNELMRQSKIMRKNQKNSATMKQSDWRSTKTQQERKLETFHWNWPASLRSASPTIVYNIRIKICLINWTIFGIVYSFRRNSFSSNVPHWPILMKIFRWMYHKVSVAQLLLRWRYKNKYTKIQSIGNNFVLANCD